MAREFDPEALRRFRERILELRVRFWQAEAEKQRTGREYAEYRLSNRRSLLGTLLGWVLR